MLTLFGLTGGLGSGKSTVAQRFRDQGLSVLDADRMAREVVQKDSEGLAAVVAAFGAGVLDPDGNLDRAAVGELVFSDADARHTLNQIVHPRIAALTAQRAAELAGRGERLACYEAALLVENGLADAFRPLVVVSAPPEAQIERAMGRDGMTRAQVQKRLDAQVPLADKLAVADYVIDNGGDLESTRRQADRVLAEIRAASGA
jgi:dephospho-CoA kinase